MAAARQCAEARGGGRAAARGDEAPVVVRLRDASCRGAGDALILDGVDLTVRRGECVLLCGRSGMGKTTVTKLINGLIPQFEPGVERTGEVEVCGFDPARCAMHELARHVVSVFQNPNSQFFNLTSNDELAFGLEAAGVDADAIEERIRATVGALHVEHLLDRGVTKMSGGEKQSLVFASVDVMDPDVYVLDEPTANLDARAIRVLHDQIAAILARGKTVIVAEHRLQPVREICADGSEADQRDCFDLLHGSVSFAVAAQTSSRSRYLGYFTTNWHIFPQDFLQYHRTIQREQTVRVFLLRLGKL